MRTFLKSIVSCMMAAVLLFVQQATAVADDVATVTASDIALDYHTYLQTNKAISHGVQNIDINLADHHTDNKNVINENHVLLWKDGQQNIDFRFEVPKSGMYNLQIEWKPIEPGLDISLGIMLDGKNPFAEAQKVVLNRVWTNADEKPKTDDFGNEYAQEQIEVNDFIQDIIHDDTGIAADPFMFLLTEGAHTLTLSAPKQGVCIKSLAFIPPEITEDYEKVRQNYQLAECSAETITIHAENASLKSDASIIPKSNNSDAGMTPVDPVLSKINYIGGVSWQKPAQKLTWNFEAEESGYYYLNFRYKQSDLINGESLRWLKIDGKTPFTQAKSIAFPYSTGWKYLTLGNESDNPYYIYLDKGSHTLSLEVTVGEKSEYFTRLSKIVDMLASEYMKIVMITGETPDVNRDYDLFKQIPQFTETLQSCHDLLNSLAADLNADSNSRSTQYTASMKNMARVLSAMLKNPYSAQQYLSDYYTNYTALGTWLYDMVNMPLALDEIYLIPYGAEQTQKEVNWFQSFMYGMKRFLLSFIVDYDSLSVSEDDSSSIRIWVSWGQDQAAALNTLIKESFTQETGINVELKIVNASLINGILSGNFPDVSLQMARTEPVNLGVRGALYDLRNFKDCDEVLNRFQQSAEVPYEYDNALYALPDTQNFFLMFYRTDIFDSLELTVPKTWDEFLEVATVIQRNNMSVYIPYTQITSATTVNSGIGSLNLFPTLMAQNHISLYNEKLTATNLVSQASIDVFTKWTELYTNYDIYKEADFYNRFRVGVMPLGIAPYSMYMTLYSAAKEINGKWSVALVPGTVNGSTAVAGAGTGCAIIKQSSHKEEAWEFLKWWTSANTQERYSKNVEAELGMLGRVATSNVEALSRLSWEPEVLKVILEEWKLVQEVPEVPGSYYLTRCIDQAYWSVVNGTSKPKDALVKWSKAADDEIAHKVREYKN